MDQCLRNQAREVEERVETKKHYKRESEQVANEVNMI
uniref:Uncharacterized protein n=1 Tax=Amphimedon queenslandica TaxID=400682 RepID=A0A1X7SK15_AMPQE